MSPNDWTLASRFLLWWALPRPGCESGAPVRWPRAYQTGRSALLSYEASLRLTPDSPSLGVPDCEGIDP